MIRDGSIVLFTFPQTDLTCGKLRPALLLRRLPASEGDWLACMISTQLRHEIAGFDDLIRDSDADYASSGLKATSLVRVGRLAVISANILHGGIGIVTQERLNRIRSRLANWLLAKTT